MITEIANVPNIEKLILADTRTRSKNEYKFYIMTKNTNKYKYSFFP